MSRPWPVSRRTPFTPVRGWCCSSSALGGALAVQTKDGRTSPGSSLQATCGSHSRRALEFESGSSGPGASFYMAGTLFGDEGWRDASPSSLRQFFSNARPLPAINGEFPVQRATFVAPGAPRLFWIGAKIGL